MTHNRLRFPFSHDTQFVYLIRFSLSFFFMFVIICDCVRKSINKVINIPINKFDTRRCCFRYKCANYGDQGISVNCSDIYKHNIDCQWVDISELEPGHYTLKVQS